jgi:hypothetical protein
MIYKICTMFMKSVKVMFDFTCFESQIEIPPKRL